MPAAANAAVLAPPRVRSNIARTEALCQLARASWRRGDSDAAIADYHKVLAADDESVEAHDSLAQLHLQRREVYDALDHSAHAADLAPNRIDVALTRAVREAVSVPVIASGGAGSVRDFVDVFRQADADAALAASLFHYGMLEIGNLKRELAKSGIHVRPVPVMAR